MFSANKVNISNAKINTTNKQTLTYTKTDTIGTMTGIELNECNNVTIKNINTNKEDTFKEKKSNVFSKIKDFFRKDKSKENEETKETNNDNLSEM